MNQDKPREVRLALDAIPLGGKAEGKAGDDATDTPPSSSTAEPTP